MARPFPPFSETPLRGTPFSVAPATLVATVSVLHALRPVVARLGAALERLGLSGLDALDRRLEREGRVAVFEGSPEQARGLEQALRSLGLTTALNLRPAPVSALRRRG